MLNEAAIRQSVRDQQPEDSIGLPATGTLFGIVPGQADILPAWGLRVRDLALRNWWYKLHGTLMQGSITQMVKRVKQTPWELVGGENQTRRFQEVFQNAERGMGWGRFLSKWVKDYLTLDFGGVLEIIGPGDPNKPLTGAITGIGYLNSLRCAPTGSDEFPLLYWSHRTGKMHRLHHTRVARMVDMPDGDEWMYDNGLCALSRMISVCHVQGLMSKYQGEKLSDLPTAGILTISGINDKQWKDAQTLYQADQRADGNEVWRNLMRLVSINPQSPVEVNLTPFADLPDHFNYREYMEVHVNLVALALGDDPQNIWPLTGTALGTGTQSKILHAKGQAKTFGDLLSEVERIVNIWALPRDMEFRFKYQDAEQDKEQAEKAQIWVNIGDTLVKNGTMSGQEVRMLLANNVEAFKDVLLDASGQLRLPDDDPKADEDVLADDTATLDTEAEPAEPTAADNANPLAKNLHRLWRDGLDRDRHKSYSATRDDFIGRVTSLIEAATGDEVTRRRFGIILRDNLRLFGDLAFRDGLADGGVEDDLSDEDRATFANLLVEQSGYVTDLGDALFKDGVVVNDAEAKSTLWANKSLDRFYGAGLLSADADGLYEFWGDDGEESCDDCQRLKGQRHRLSEWEENAFNPFGDNSGLFCGGWRCEHTLVRVKGRARGSW